MGRQIGKWRLRNTLGSGSFGEVKYAVNVDTGRQAAAKICAKQTVAKGQGRTLLQREIATMKELNHPNVLKLYEVLETSRHYYLVLELASGGELFDLIQENKRFGDSTARKYFQQLILGVRYCHEQGIVHRDLKPQNLLLTAEDELKIADFGFSNFQNLDADGNVTPALRLQTQCGTPNYAAPEIFLGKGYDGFKTDIWSCGVILYVMLCGHVPFRPVGRGGGLQGVIMAIMEGKYTVPEAVSKGAAEVIDGILQKDTDKRMSTDQIIAHEWYKVGFDNSRAASLPKIVVTESSIAQAIHTGEEEVDTLGETVTALPADTAASDEARTEEPEPEIIDALLPAGHSTRPTSPISLLGSPSSAPSVDLGGPSAPASAASAASIPGCDQLGRILRHDTPDSSLNALQTKRTKVWSTLITSPHTHPYSRLKILLSTRFRESTGTRRIGVSVARSSSMGWADKGSAASSATALCT